MRASRLVSLLLLLQTRGQLTAGELARELEVSERTIHRDVEALSASGVPIYAERGVHGGIRLVDGYRTRLTGMTADEAEALFLAGIPGPAAELGLGTVVAAAQLKVLASLPPELRTRASRLVERFHLDAGEWFGTSQPVPHLGTLAEAVWEARRIAITYDRDGGGVRRDWSRSVWCSRPGSGTSSPGSRTTCARIASRGSSRSSRSVRSSSARRHSTSPPTGPNRPPHTSATCPVSTSSCGFVRTGSITSDRRSATRSSPPPSTSTIPIPTAGYGSGCGWTGRRRRRGIYSRPVAGSRSSSPPRSGPGWPTARAIAERYARRCRLTSIAATPGRRAALAQQLGSRVGAAVVSRVVRSISTERTGPGHPDLGMTSRSSRSRPLP